MSPPAVLIVAEDTEIQARTQAVLAGEGIGPVTSLRCRESLTDYLSEHPIDLVLLDLGAEPQSGIELIGDITASHPAVAVVAVSGTDETATTMSCLQRGAYDCLVKPLVPHQVASVARRALGLQRQRQAPTNARLGHGTAFRGIITQDPAMQAVFAYVQAVARSGQPVLITGETGTGKDLIARAIHDLSGRDGAFVPMNTAGMDDTMLSDSLFGHRRGAFTGATDVRPGLVLSASAGTLFLDEIGDLSAVSQVKLLRLLQDGDYYPLGSDLPKKSTARIIAATSADLDDLQHRGLFRKDLFYRLKAHLIDLPPLRARVGDLPLLLQHFTRLAANDLGRASCIITDDLVALLADHSFPGNVRELRSLVYDAVCRTPDGEPLSTIPFRAAIRNSHTADTATHSVTFPPVLPTVAEMQDLLVKEALRRARGNQAQAATMLGITRQALNKRLRR
jgi:DNA-binding NtrC family response regulator